MSVVYRIEKNKEVTFVESGVVYQAEDRIERRWGVTLRIYHVLTSEGRGFRAVAKSCTRSATFGAVSYGEDMDNYEKVLFEGRRFLLEHVQTVKKVCRRYPWLAAKDLFREYVLGGDKISPPY